MNRYAVISKGLSVSEITREVKRVGGLNIREAPLTEQVFCDLDDEAAARLDEIPGLTVKKVKTVSAKYTDAKQVRIPVYGQAEAPTELQPTYSTLYGSQAARFYELRDMFTPPVTGAGATCAILDSGVRKTHRGLRGKIIREINLSNSPIIEDVFDHGTGVAYIMCGGRHALGEDSGLAPGAKVISIKVLNDNGEGSEENVVLGLEEVIKQVREAYDAGVGLTDPMNIHAVSLSFGAPDDGDPDNPIRVACRKVVHCHEPYSGYTMIVAAAAGNEGPGPGTIMLPACDPEVLAVGAMTFYPFDVAVSSSRGPTKEGLIKPDVVFFGIDINVASAKSDDAYVVKSGTSFSTPFMVGGGFCGWEMFRRYYGLEATISRQEWNDWIKRITIKPEGAPSEKDNTYGYGFPWGGEMIRETTGMAVPGMAVSTITEMITPLVGIGMLGMMMAGVMKGMK